MQEPQEQHRRFGRAEVAGARLLGRFVPWSTLAAVCALTLAATSVAVVTSGDEGGRQIDAATNGTVGDEIPVEEDIETTSTTAAEATTTTLAPTTTTAAVPSTTSTVPPATTTAPPATVTTIAPGGADISIISGAFGDGNCHQAAADWSFIAVCPDQNFGPDGRPELAARFEPVRYPKSARVHLEVVAGAGHDVSYCLRLFDLTTRVGVPGSERCLTSPAVPPVTPYESSSPTPMRTEQIGPLTLSASRYTLQAKVSRASTGEPCKSEMANCSGQLTRAQITVDWG